MLTPEDGARSSSLEDVGETRGSAHFILQTRRVSVTVRYNQVNQKMGRKNDGILAPSWGSARKGGSFALRNSELRDWVAIVGSSNIFLGMVTTSVQVGGWSTLHDDRAVGGVMVYQVRNQLFGEPQWRLTTVLTD